MGLENRPWFKDREGEGESIAGHLALLFPATLSHTSLFSHPQPGACLLPLGCGTSCFLCPVPGQSTEGYFCPRPCHSLHHLPCSPVSPDSDHTPPPSSHRLSAPLQGKLHEGRDMLQTPPVCAESVRSRKPEEPSGSFLQHTFALRKPRESFGRCTLASPFWLTVQVHLWRTRHGRGRNGTKILKKGREEIPEPHLPHCSDFAILLHLCM